MQRLLSVQRQLAYRDQELQRVVSGWNDIVSCCICQLQCMDAARLYISRVWGIQGVQKQRAGTALCSVEAMASMHVSGPSGLVRLVFCAYSAK